MQKGMNTRGQSMWIYIIMGLVALLLLIIISTGILNVRNIVVDPLVELAPEEIGLVGSACDGYVSLQSRADYCSFRLIEPNSGNEFYTNCVPNEVQQYMDSSSTFRCDTNANTVEDDDDSAIRFCQGLYNTQDLGRRDGIFVYYGPFNKLWCQGPDYNEEVPQGNNIIVYTATPGAQLDENPTPTPTQTSYLICGDSGTCVSQPGSASDQVKESVSYIACNYGGAAAGSACSTDDSS